jgi:FtsH-binding integral membrane protein
MATDPWSTPGPAVLGVGASSTTAAFMAKVYRWMAGGLLLTGAVAAFTANSPTAIHAIFSTPLMWILMAAELGLVFAFTRIVRTASFGTVAAMFLAYCALSGVTFSAILLAYTRQSIASTFFVTGGTFLAMSVFGTVTKKDLSSWASFLFMGLIGVVLASVVNLFLHSGALSFVVSCAGVVVFTGLTAYDTQKIRAYADAGDDRLALNGALSLYLDFVNLFLMLLRLFGRRR